MAPGRVIALQVIRFTVQWVEPARMNRSRMQIHLMWVITRWNAEYPWNHTYPVTNFSPCGNTVCLEKEIDHLSQRRRATLCLFSDSTMCIELLSCRNMPRPSRDIMVIDRCFFTIETANANVSKSIDRSIINARILFLRSVIIQLRIFIQIHILASIIENVYDLGGDLCHPLKMKSTWTMNSFQIRYILINPRDQNFIFILRANV